MAIVSLVLLINIVAAFAAATANGSRCCNSAPVSTTPSAFAFISTSTTKRRSHRYQPSSKTSLSFSSSQPPPQSQPQRDYYCYGFSSESSSTTIRLTTPTTTRCNLFTNNSWCGDGDDGMMGPHPFDSRRKSPSSTTTALFSRSKKKSKHNNVSNKNQPSNQGVKWQLYYDKLVDFRTKHGHVNIQQIIDEYEDNNGGNEDSSAAHDNESATTTTTANNLNIVNIDELQELLNWYDEQVDGYKKLMLKQKTKLTKKRAYALQQINALPSDYNFDEYDFED